MERSQTENALGNATQPRLLRVIHHLLAGIHDTDRLATNLGCLHDDFQTREGVSRGE